MFNKLKKVKGFTLIELIIVIAIIAILAAIAVPAFGQIRQKANVSTDMGNARTIYSVVAAELADEQVILPADGTGKTYLLTEIGESKTAGGKGNEAISSTQLPNLSKPKAYQNHQFTVWLDSNGNIEIYVSPIAFTAETGRPSISGNDRSYQIYPTPATTDTGNRYAK